MDSHVIMFLLVSVISLVYMVAKLGRIVLRAVNLDKELDRYFHSDLNLTEVADTEGFQEISRRMNSFPTEHKDTINKWLRSILVRSASYLY